MQQYEYSTTQLPSTGDTTRGYQIYRWDHESFQTDEGETHWKCKFVWVHSPDELATAIAEKYPEADVDAVIGGF